MSTVVKRFALFLSELTLELSILNLSFIINSNTNAKQSGCEVIAMAFYHNSVVYQIITLQEKHGNSLKYKIT